MIDIVQPVDYGAMFESIPNAESTQRVQQADTNLANAQVPGAIASGQSQQLQNQLFKQKLQYGAAMLHALNSQPPPANDTGTSSAQGAADAAAAPPSAPEGGADADSENPTQPGSPAAPNEDQTSMADAGIDPAHLDATAQHLYAVPSIRTPQENQLYQQALAADAMYGTNYATAIDKQFNNRISQASAQAQQNASQSYDKANAVVTAPDGQAFNILGRVAAPLAAKIGAVAKADQWTPEQIDSASRSVMTQWGNAVHRYSGRPIKQGDDGLPYDEQTGQPLLGGTKQGVSSNTAATAEGRSAGTGLQMVSVPDGKGGTTQMPQWQAAGFPSYEAFKRTSTPSLYAGPGPAPGGTPGAPDAAPGAPGAPGAPAGGGATGAPVPAPPSPAVPSVPHVSDPVLRTALGDTSYRANLPTAAPGTTLAPDQEEERKTYAKEKNDLLEDAQEQTDAAAQGLTYLDAARQVLASPGYTPQGWRGPAATVLSRATQALGITSGNWASKQQELVKYLGNAALQGARGTYGNRMTQNEVKLQLEQLSPNMHQTPQALGDLVSTMRTQAQYAIDSAHRVRPYLAAGNDARSYEDWNQHYYPRQQVVLGGSGGAASTPQAPAVGAVVRGFKYNGGDPSKSTSWSKQ